MPPRPSPVRAFGHRGGPSIMHPPSGRLHLLDSRRIAGHRGAAHVADLAFVEPAYPVHRLTIVPHDQIVLPPMMDMDELRLYRMFHQIAKQSAGFRDRPADDRPGM